MQRASAYLPRAAALGLDDYAVHRGRARSLGQLGRNEESLAEGELALARNPDGYEAWIDRGVTLSRQKRHADALAAHERAAEIKPAEVLARRNVAHELYWLERYEEALTAYKQVIDLAPDDWSAWYWKGISLERLGRFDEALATYDDALTRAPDDATIRGARDALLRRMQRDIPDQRMRLPDGRALGYLDFGDPNGFPIFYFHGIPGSRLELIPYDRLLKELHIRLIAPDRPGIGLSTYQPHRTMLDWPDDMAALADHLGVASFAVLGVSGGGAYAAACACKLPERVTALGLVSSAAPPEAFRGKFEWTPTHISRWVTRHSPMLALRLFSAITARLIRNDPASFAELYSKRERGILLRRDAPETHESPAAVLAPLDREMMIEPYHQGASGIALDERLSVQNWGFPLERITVPARLWHGEADLLAPVALGRYLATNIPHCQATYYPDERHGVLNAHTREIFTALLAASTTGAMAAGSLEHGLSAHNEKNNE